jgi:hypothetical protein
MPRVLKRPKVEADRLYRCWMPFSGDDDNGVPVTIQSGTRLLGNHPAVRKWPQFFVSDDAPDDEELHEPRHLGRRRACSR